MERPAATCAYIRRRIQDTYYAGGRAWHCAVRRGPFESEPSCGLGARAIARGGDVTFYWCVVCSPSLARTWTTRLADRGSEQCAEEDRGAWHGRQQCGYTMYTRERLKVASAARAVAGKQINAQRDIEPEASDAGGTERSCAVRGYAAGRAWRCERATHAREPGGARAPSAVPREQRRDW